MPASIDSIVDSARREWQHWGQSTWNVNSGAQKVAHTDDELAYAQYVLNVYCRIGGGSPSIVDIQDDRYYWSAVGMSAILKGAGFTKPEFPFSQSHSVFIRHFVRARKMNDQGARFLAYRVGEPGGQPQVGDLVAYARGKKMTAEKAAGLFDSTAAYESHSDVVVDVRPGEIDVIGANVLDSVTLKTLKRNHTGHIDSDPYHFWFAILKNQQPQG